MVSRVHSVLWLLIVTAVVGCSGHAGGGPPKQPDGCCQSDQMMGKAQLLEDLEVVGEFGYYSDCREGKSLLIGHEQNRLIDQTARMLYVLTHYGCTKSKLLTMFPQCFPRDVTFQSRFQSKALSGKGWRWIHACVLEEEAPRDKKDPADPSKMAVHTYHVDAATCLKERLVSEYPDGSRQEFVMKDVQSGTDDPDVYTLDIGECVGVVGEGHKAKTEL